MKKPRGLLCTSKPRAFFSMVEASPPPVSFAFQSDVEQVARVGLGQCMLAGFQLYDQFALFAGDAGVCCSCHFLSSLPKMSVIVIALSRVNFTEVLVSSFRHHVSVSPFTTAVPLLLDVLPVMSNTLLFV